MAHESSEEITRIQESIEQLSFKELFELRCFVGATFAARCNALKPGTRRWEDYKSFGEPTPRIPLTEYCVTLTKMPPGKRAIDAEDDAGDFIGSRTKLGGKPNWIQGDSTPQCVECRLPMIFVAQIDSLDCAEKRKTNQPDEWMFGDCGMLYVFSCPDCGREECLNQCY